jgi:1-deoxy-D-xylulose-5-phosphate reductoisomerase
MTFRNLDLAFEAMHRGGNMPCILNAANEIAVEAFLNRQIGFLEMSDLVEYCMEKIAFIAKPQYDDYVLTDRETRAVAREKAGVAVH